MKNESRSAEGCTPAVSRRVALALPGAALAAPALAQGRFPAHPIRIFVPWTAGSSSDVQMRSLAELAQQSLGQPVVTENRPGASGTLHAQPLAAARPDGHTLGQMHLSVVRRPFLVRQPQWDAVADYTHILRLCGWMYGVAVKADSPHRSWGDLVASARANPGRLTFATSGIATTNHIAMEEILEREGAEMTHIPFRGAQEGVTALLGKQIDVVADAQSWRPNVETGELRLLSVWTRDRLPSFPDAPTLRELGYDMVVTSPYGIVGPKGLPPEIVDTLHRAFRKALEDEASQAIIDRWEMPREYLGPAEYLSFAKERVEYEKRMVARMKLSID